MPRTNFHIPNIPHPINDGMCVCVCVCVEPNTRVLCYCSDVAQQDMISSPQEVPIITEMKLPSRPDLGFPVEQT